MMEQKKKYDVFISYTFSDSKISEKVCGYLESHNIRCFLAHRDINEGIAWRPEAVADAIKQSRLFLSVFSREYNISAQTDREIEIAAANFIPIVKCRLTSVYMTSVKRRYLKDCNGIDFFPHLELCSDRLTEFVNRMLNGNYAFFPEITSNREGTGELEKLQLSFAVNGVSFRMIHVPGGTFQMGDTASQQTNYGLYSEKPVHDVILPDFFIGETAVTQALWKAVIRNNPSYFKGDDLPVENVSYQEIVHIFLPILNEILHACLPSNRKFRLPTEAEWEYAARGGKSGGPIFAGSNAINQVAWYSTNAKQTHPVGQKLPNDLGLFDMSGNVWEWCKDGVWNYCKETQYNPKGSSNHSYRMLRGGGWTCEPWWCRVSRRYSLHPHGKYNDTGFRLAISR